jgi:DNA-binding Lrp family transcriptional regulator
MAELDAFDLRLLAALQREGRLANQELGERVGLSASQCSRRRAALEKAGFIRGYQARLGAEALGFTVTAFIRVALTGHSEENASLFAALVGRTEEIQEAYAITGESDYLLKAVLPDLASLARLVNEILLRHGSVASVRSSIALDRLKDTAMLPLGRLKGR